MPLPEIEHAEHAAAVGAKLLQAVTGPHAVGSQEARITGSLGISLYPDHGWDAATLIVNADAAMYDAKRAGSGTLRLAMRSRPEPMRLDAGGDDAAHHYRL